jgi:F0F1-type ATP synthase gamma subunit
MKNQENVIRKQSNISTFADMSKTATMIAQDISAFLSEEIDELNVYSYTFKSGIERCILRVLNGLYKQPQPVVIFPDSIPGFTLMVFKKSSVNIDDSMPAIKRAPLEEMKEVQVLDSVINRFFAKNQQQVMIIDTADLLFALFPVADTRKNLKDMDLYVTF